jgi:hypothetical protein
MAQQGSVARLVVSLPQAVICVGRVLRQHRVSSCDTPRSSYTAAVLLHSQVLIGKTLAMASYLKLLLSI